MAFQDDFEEHKRKLSKGTAGFPMSWGAICADHQHGPRNDPIRAPQPEQRSWTEPPRPSAPDWRDSLPDWTPGVPSTIRQTKQPPTIQRNKVLILKQGIFYLLAIMVMVFFAWLALVIVVEVLR
jgi:hypothetical protein